VSAGGFPIVAIGAAFSSLQADQIEGESFCTGPKLRKTTDIWI
jgi:hypothetical protein